MPGRLVVVGAGPIGLAAALGALQRGYDVTVIERGEVGESLRNWGATRFFSPMRMNVSSAMREVLGSAMPPDDALLTGREFADEILGELARRDPLRGRIKERHNVVAIGRRGLTRGDYAGHPLRAERPFRLVIEGPTGELALDAEVVLDASGGYVVPRPFGAGGLPARGESLIGSRSIRTLGDLDARRGELRGKRILLIGHGHSAANAINILASIAAEDPATCVTWAVRSANRRPCEEVANDPLPERQRVVEQANQLAEEPPAFLRVERRAMVETLAANNGHFEVALTGDRGAPFDAIVAFTGYRPDSRMLSELAVETSPVTEGAARLYRAISNVTDCLSTPLVRKEDLETGEPNFYFIGSRSYGRARTFLLQTGLSQLETVLDGLPR